MSSLDRLVVSVAIVFGSQALLSGCASTGEPLLRTHGGLVMPVPAVVRDARRTDSMDSPGAAEVTWSAPFSAPTTAGLSAGIWRQDDPESAAAAGQDDELIEVVKVEGPAANSFVMPTWDESRNEVSLHLGVSWWDDLPDHQPRQAFPTVAGFGRQESTGFAMALSYRRRVVDIKETSLWLGADFGLMSHEESSSYNVRLPNGDRINDDVTAGVLYLTVSGKVDVPLGPVSIFAGGGAGLYNLTFSEEDDYWSSDEIVDDSAFGGYLQLGLDVPVGERFSVRIEDRMHLVNFDGLNRFTPGNDSLSGPIHTFLIGVGFRF